MLDKIDIDNILPDEITKIIEFLQNLLGATLGDKSTLSKLVCRENNNHCCPYCESLNIVKNGHSKKRAQRYKCKDCKHRFCDTTNTTSANSKLTYEIWLNFFKCMIDKTSIRKTAAKLGLNKNTVFSMRHKVLNALSIFRKGTKLSGDIQSDEKYESINLKGTKKANMPRASKPRKSKGGSKRGISNHQICIASAIDENDNIYLEIVGNGPITTQMIKKAFKDRIQPNSILITDCKSSYEKFAVDNNIKLEQVKSGTYKNSNGYTLSEINGVHSNLDLFLKCFVGVSTKHLQGYLDWFIYQKYLTYAIEVLNQPQVLMNYVLCSNSFIKVSNIYSKEFPVDIFDVYSDYNFNPSPQI